MRIERIAGASKRMPAPDLSKECAVWFIGCAAIEQAPYVVAAESIAAGRLSVFSLDNCNIGDPPMWNRDVRTGITAPLKFGKSLNYRDESLVGDIKYLWEPNRHLHLVTLAQAYRLSGDRSHLRVLRRHLDSWFEQCPYPYGPNWSSSLEAAIRLINWSIAWQLIGGLRCVIFDAADGTAFRDRWLESVYRHSEFVRGHFSRYSSANNHLIGEAAGLFVAAMTWPLWPASKRWAAVSKDILEREALAQNAADGVNREQAVSYQQFVLDFLLLAGLAGRAGKSEFTPAFWARIESMLNYLAAIMDVGGNVPMIGDADDGYAVRLTCQQAFDPYRSLLATGAVLFGRADFKSKAGYLDEKSKWLLGEGAPAAYAAVPAVDALASSRQFPEGGYCILGVDFETSDEIRIVVDAGPLGYQSIAAHGHADALSFTLSMGGKEFLVDPGTYAYHTQKPWRDYFRGTAAHNTARVDGLDQSIAGGNFMWTEKARASLERWSEGEAVDMFEASHDGYRRLPDPLTHRRRLRLEKKRRVLLIDDQFECLKFHRVELFWHFSEHCDVRLSGRDVIARNGDRSIRLCLPDAGNSDCRLYRGSDDPIAGWVSRRFDRKVPAATIAWSALISGSVGLHTEIHCDARSEAAAERGAQISK